MKSTGQQQQSRVTVEKSFQASPKTVFDAWLDTNMIARWMFGPEPRDEEVLSLQNNPEKGGTFSFKVRRNGENLDHRGTYREIDRPNRLIFTWGTNEESGDESVVSIHIKPTNSRCKTNTYSRIGFQMRRIHRAHPKRMECHAAKTARNY